MARAVIWSPIQGSYGWVSGVSSSRQDIGSSKFCGLGVKKSLLSSRSLPLGCAAGRIRSYSDSASASTDEFKGRYASLCFDGLCAQTCPVNRDTYVQSWLEESVHEIVRNIQEAPFLQYVFDSKQRFGRSHRQKISKELLNNPDQWSGSSLRESLSQADPDGVILVQKLESRCPSDCCLAEAFQFGKHDSEMALQADHLHGGETSVWGVLVQARGLNANACYLLETTRVASPAGICTRYCLTKAKCFGQSPIYQLESAWLL